MLLIYITIIKKKGYIYRRKKPHKFFLINIGHISMSLIVILRSYLSFGYFYLHIYPTKKIKKKKKREKWLNNSTIIFFLG